MNIVRWLTGFFSARDKALALCKRGMDRAKLHDHQGALSDYSLVLGMAEAKAEVKAMALYNRALVQSAIGDEEKAIDDLNVLLAMAEAPVTIKTEAKRKLVRMDRRTRSSRPGDSRNKT